MCYTFEGCLVQAYTVSGPPCLSVLVHVHVYISVILVIHGSHYNPAYQSHIIKTLTSYHPWCPWIVDMKATLVRVSMPVTVTMTILGCPWIINMKATLVRVSMPVTVTMTIHGCPGIVNMKATLVRVSMSVIVTMTIHENFIRVSKFFTVILIVQSATMVIVDNVIVIQFSFIKS